MQANNTSRRATSPGKRLLTAVKYVRRGAVLTDIGTDHALLPIYLLQEGIIKRAILSDINEGPLESARKNAAAADVSDMVELVLADGADGLADSGATDIVIFGMGGELIADIIERAPFFKRSGIRLILQPMTKHVTLCKYLLQNGFSIIGESYSSEGGKFYRTLCAEYGGAPDTNVDEIAKIGLCATPCDEIAAKIGFLSASLASNMRAYNGKLHAALDASDLKHTTDLISKEIDRLSKLFASEQGDEFHDCKGTL